MDSVYFEVFAIWLLVIMLVIELTLVLVLKKMNEETKKENSALNDIPCFIRSENAGQKNETY